MSIVSASKIVLRYKNAVDKQNPLLVDTWARPQVVRYLYKLVGRTADGFFSDNYWEPITKIFKLFHDHGVDVTITNTTYTKDDHGNPNAKIWKLEIPFLGKSGKPQILYGTITAAGAGSINDVLNKYDVTVILS